MKCAIFEEHSSSCVVYFRFSGTLFPVSMIDGVVIRPETNEKMDLKGHYPQNTISHCIISNETQITLHFFQGRISAMPEMRTDLFLAISKTGMCLLTL